MKDLLCAACWCVFTLAVNSCATYAGAAYPTPEQMPEGRVACTELCKQHGREYEEYRYDGKCVCKAAQKLIPLDASRQM